LALFVIALFVGEVTTGAVGATVSIVIVITVDAGEIFPALSVAFAVIPCTPSTIAETGVNVNVPATLADVVPIDTLFKKIVTIEFDSADPEMVGLLLFVMDPLVGDVINGANGAVESIRIVTTVLEGDIFPDVSVDFAVKLCDPDVSALDGVNVKVAPVTVAVPADVPSTYTVTVVPATVVPDIIGITLFVEVPVKGIDIVGAVGATVSIVRDIDVLNGDVFPAVSVAFEVTLCVPSAILVVGVKVNVPAGDAVVVPAEIESISIATTVLPSALPDIIGLLLLVDNPLTGDVIIGADGAIVSTVIEIDADCGDMLPAASVASTLIVCVADESATVGVNEKLVPEAVTVPTTTLSKYTLTLEPASVVPDTIGLLLIVTDPLVGESIIGVAGAVESIITVMILLNGETLFELSVAVHLI
jgi:hypothetical protein